MMGFAQRPMGFAVCGPRHWCAPVRECRREAKELLVRSSKEAAGAVKQPLETLQPLTEMKDAATETVALTGVRTEAAANLEVIQRAVSGEAIIGGGCCVHLAVEYMPALPATANKESSLRVTVVDSDGAVLSWAKTFQGGYHVKEGIIITYPGALLRVQVENAIARVRWCEVFSC
jgi:hypothetical protein